MTRLHYAIETNSGSLVNKGAYDMRGGMIRNRHKHTRYILLAFFAVGIVALFPLPTFAASLELYIHNFVFGVVGWIVAASASTLDWSYTELVAKMGTNFINQGIGSVINEMWTVIRDLFNILFIFGLIYIGFRTILFSDDTQTKRALGWLIVAALLINFSLFVTKAVVDISNLTAIQVHSALTTKAGGSISSTFKRIIEINSMNYFELDKEKLEDGDIAWTYYMGVLLLGIVITVTFFAGAFMLFARFIALVFLLVLSPVMFVGMIFPKFDEYAKMYWDRLLNYAFFAPFFLFALLLSAKTLQVLSNQIDGGNKLYEQAFNPNLNDPTLSDLHVIAFLLISMGFMIGSIILAQRMGVAGASSTMNVFGKLKGGARNQIKRASYGAARAAGNITGSAAARAGRNTFGRAAYNLKEGRGIFGSEKANNMGQQLQRATKRGGLTGLAARRAQAAAAGIAGASFDPRRNKLGEKLGLKQGKKGGFQQLIDDHKKAARKAAGGIGPDDSVYGDYGVQAQHQTFMRKTIERAEKVEQMKNTSDQNLKKQLGNEITQLDQDIKNMQSGELPTDHKYNKSYEQMRAEGGMYTEKEWADLQRKARQRWKLFARARKDAKNYGREKYARIIEEDGWRGSKTFRVAEAQAIRKEMNKDANDRIIDVLKEQGSKGNT